MLNKFALFTVIATCIAYTPFGVCDGPSDSPSIFDLTLEDLLNIKVTSVSGVEETIADAPASIVVITEQDIRLRGYHSLNEIFSDLPGFDSYVLNSSRYINAYQRGYRTPFMSRTLFLVNGRTQNHLWDQVAYTERQWPLSNIERIEVLYGPASAIYGPNAFLGVINLITKDGSELDNGEDKVETRLAYGSWNTVNLDMSVRGNHNKFHYAISAKLYQSDEPDLSDFGIDYGWNSNELYGSEDIWGPLLQLKTHGTQLGKYANPADDWGIMAELGYGKFQLSYSNWEISEGYGPSNAADKSQAGVRWIKNATEYALTHVGSLLDTVNITTLLSYRTSQLSGGWAEASIAADDAAYSYISFSDWDTQNSATLFEQDYEHRLNHNWQLNGGIKFEYKELTKAFDVCGYWSGSLCSSGAEPPGPLGFGAGVFDSRSDTYELQPGTSGTIPASNINKTKNYGAYLQAIYDQDNWRVSTGLSYYNNSDYGSSSNPRISVLYRLNELSRIKLLYGESFQEPPNILLFGGWNGRRANPDLNPETLKNYEIIYQFQQKIWQHELSLYQTEFNNVIKEEALNAGQRTVTGFEYRGRVQFDNFIAASKQITGYLYYTYTDNSSSIHYEYDHVDDEFGGTSNGWFEGSTDIGDISPHKLNVGINMPIKDNWNINIRGQYHGSTKLYSRNRLRAQGEDLDAYTVVNLALSYYLNDIGITLRVDNLFNEKYFIPGERAANAGNDFSATRSSGFKNSLIPTPTRSFMLMMSTQF